MIDYDIIKKAKQLYAEADAFDKKWVSAKGVFRLLHKAGAINDEDFEEISKEFDRILAPIHKAEAAAKDYVLDKGMKFMWNLGLGNKGDK